MTIVSSNITAVKIYHSGATVYRRIELEPKDGRLPEEVEIVSLPLALYDPTVRLRVESIEGQGDLLAADIRVGLYVAPKKDLPPDPDKQELRELEQKIAERDMLLEEREQEIGMLSGMAALDRPEPEQGKPPPPSPMAARIALEELVDDSVRARIAENRALKAELRDLREKAADVRQRMMLASRARTAEAHELTKSVAARLRQGEGRIEKARLVLEYFIPGARWSPAYRVLLSRDSSKAEIQLRALICQSSGEDWRSVKLMLSTAAPLRWSELPELSSIRIGKAQPSPPRRRGFRPPPTGALALFEDFDQGRMRALSLAPPPPEWSKPDLALAPFESGPRDAPANDAPLQPPPPATAMVASVKSMPAPMEATDDLSLSEVSEDDGPSALFSVHRNFGAPLRGAGFALDDAQTGSGMSPLDSGSGYRRLAKQKANGAERARASGVEVAIEAHLFASLRLAEPDDVAGRNRLSPIDLRAAYAESLAKLGVEIRVDAMSVVEQAQARAAAVGRLPHPSGSADVRAASGHFDFAYDADAPIDVPSDGTFHSIALGGRQSDCDMRYVVVPREDNHVYRIAELKNPIAAPLLPGSAEVYVGGEYVLTANIPTVTPHGSFQLGLGVEQAIKCARNTHFRETRSGSKVVATNELWHDIEIKLANNLDRDIRCEVRERIPQPHPDAEVVVEEGKVDPRWEAYDQEERGQAVEGGRRWAITVPARKEATLCAQYVVKIYANNEIAGGNRREV
jgi:hypothetical protein